MNRIRPISCTALIQTLSVLAVCFGGVDVQVNAQENRSIIRMIPEPSARISSRMTVQDPLNLDDNGSVRRLPELPAPARPAQQDTKKQDPEPDGAQSDQELNDVLEMEDDDLPTRPRQRTAFGPWPEKSIRAISLDIREGSGAVTADAPEGDKEKHIDAPKDRTGELMVSPRAPWAEFDPTQKVFAWAAPDIKYQPLYFEDVALERYGQTTGLYRQPLRSGIEMCKSFVFLPNQMLHDAPRSCDYPLGFCRPGNAVPYTFQKHYFGHGDR